MASCSEPKTGNIGISLPARGRFATPSPPRGMPRPGGRSGPPQRRPATIIWGATASKADQVTKDRKLVGTSSSTIYSYHFSKCLSMGCIDEALCQPSTELVTRWGDHGKRIKDMRVTVDRFPLRAARRNQWRGRSSLKLRGKKSDG
jgi:hypothetical protein